MNLSKVYPKWQENSEYKYCYVIGEIGINHNGSIDLAKKMIQMAKIAGCDAVKFQKRNIDVAVPIHMRDKKRDTPWGEITYYEYKKRVEFGLDQFKEIDKFCSDIEIEWSASAWDVDSLEFLRQFNLPFNKVASAMVTNLEFLKNVASEGKITFVSTGMCDLQNIQNAIEIFENYKCPFILMHTVSTYPTELNELNLLMIRTLKSKYPHIPIGYSGHESSVMPSVYSVVMGAIAVERHITTDRTLFGTDQSASLELRGLSKMISEIRKIPFLMGDGIKSFGEKERIVATKLRPNNYS